MSGTNLSLVTIKKLVYFAQFFLGLPRNAHFFLLTCDKAYFYLIPPVNKQNSRRWLASKPTDKIERSMHGEKVLLWCTSYCRVYIPSSTITGFFPKTPEMGTFFPIHVLTPCSFQVWFFLHSLRKWELFFPLHILIVI